MYTYQVACDFCDSIIKLESSFLNLEEFVQEIRDEYEFFVCPTCADEIGIIYG